MRRVRRRIQSFLGVKGDGATTTPENGAEAADRFHRLIHQHFEVPAVYGWRSRLVCLFTADVKSRFAASSDILEVRVNRDHE